MRLRACAAFVLAALLALAQPAAAAAVDERGPIGGPLLGRSGVVVRDSGGAPKPPKVSASSYVVADAKTGQILAAKDPHGRYRPASTLKVLTAITLIPKLDKDQKVQPRREDVDVEGSRVGITTKMRYRVEDLFLGLMLASGNDAALALARAGGGLRHTLALMNAKADELHAYDTTAETPNGLDRPGQRSSAYDLALFARAGLDLPAFREYIGTARAEFPAPKGKSFQISHHDDLLTEYKGSIGGKTGYTTKAESTYVGMAERDGRTLIVTFLHAKPASWQEDATDLVDWGFAVGETEPVGELVEPGPLPSATPAETAAPAVPLAPEESDAPARGTAVREMLTEGTLADRFGMVLLAVLAALVLSGSALLLRLRRRPARRYQGRRRQGGPQ